MITKEVPRARLHIVTDLKQYLTIFDDVQVLPSYTQPVTALASHYVWPSYSAERLAGESRVCMNLRVSGTVPESVDPSMRRKISL